MADTFTLELLHAADQEPLNAGASLSDITRFSAVWNALQNQDLGNDGLPDNTLLLSSGDAVIPGLFYDASAGVFGSEGIADIQIQNELGFQAIAFGNHEFDKGTEELAALLDGSAAGDFSALTGSILEGLDFTGTNFPYLSTNLDFSTDANLAPLEIAGGQAPQGNVVTPSTVIDVNGEKIGVVGATTPTLASISSPGTVGIAPDPFGANPTPEELDALAAEIQAEVDALLAANLDMNKVVLLAHMQRLSIERELAARLENVDIIVGGGSNTRLFDENDRVRAGDSAQGEYPEFITNAGGTQTALVNTDGSYKYVGRLVVDFDAEGNIIPESYDPAVSGAYATDAQGVTDLGAEGLIDPEIQAIVDAIEAQILATEGNVFGVSNVFLNGNRSGIDTPENSDGVRTQETNLGNLTADANLAIAKEFDPSVVVSIKNGGGIRASIGQTIVPPGSTEAVRSPNEAVLDSEGNVVKPEGGISQNDIATTLAFNNDLTLLTLTKAELVAVLEHGVGALPDVSGRFPQISGVKFSYDPDLEVGDRILSAGIFDKNNNLIAELVQGGEIVGDATETFRIVTLGFLADGGDSYPFPMGEGVNRVSLSDLDGNGEADTFTGDALFAADGTEQDALAEYLLDNFETTPFNQAETGRDLDERIQNLNFRADTVLGEGIGEPPSAPAIDLQVVGSYTTGAFDEGAAEISAYDAETKRLFVVNANAVTVDILDLSNPTTPTKIGEIDATQYGAGANSVAVSNGILAVAIESEIATDNGEVVFFDTLGNFLGEVEVGALPDMVVFTPDGTKVLVANEGEPDDGINPEGSISIIDLSNGVANATVDTAGFTAFDGQEAALRAEGVRIFPGVSFSQDAEPEYISVSPDGTQAFVSLQENNALAVVDIAGKQVTDIIGLGAKDHSQAGNGFDASDRDDAINIQPQPVFGLYMPDAISSYEFNGMTYIVTANEGDARDEDARVKDLVLDPVAFPNAEELQQDENLGRLEVSTIDGDVDGDGDYDALYAYGSRSFTIFDTEGNVIFDSGDDFEQITASLLPDYFNSTNDENGSFDSRSDAKGPEPEGVVIGAVDGSTYAFVGLERVGGIMVYDITDPSNASFVQYINNRNFEVEAQLEDGSTNPAVGDLGPEGLTFIAAEDNFTGEALLAVSNEISGTTTIYSLADLKNLVIDQDQARLAGTDLDDAIGGQSALALAGLGGNDTLTGNNGDNTLKGNDGNDLIFGGLGNDSLLGGAGNDELIGGAGDDTLLGGDGDDILIGGLGADVMVGGAGADIFVFESADDLAGDSIRGFEIGTDRFDIRPLLANENITVADIEDAFAQGILAVGGNSRRASLLFDADGAGAGEAVTLATVKVSNGTTADLGADSFIV
jgi:2',3'-cyclic-nucleotide 2'-phosphodiesterase/3'-nucleotidase/5'-nucleotidase